MKATGIIRRIDDLGRVVIPKEVRRTMGITEGDPLEIFVEDAAIQLKKYVEVDRCVVCRGYQDDLIKLDSVKVCRPCAELAAKLVKR